jgi:hypothetical protein
MSLELPVLLALTGTALAAVAVLAPRELPPPSLAVSALVMAPRGAARWPAAVDASFAGADAPTRTALAAALGALATPWARAVLAHALADEADPTVRAALAGAASCQSEVT